MVNGQPCMPHGAACFRRLFQEQGNLPTHGFDSFVIIRPAIWSRHRIAKSKLKIQHHWRRVTSMCFEPSFLLGRVTVCHALMQIESLWLWIWFVGWDAAPHRFTIRGWHLVFCTIGYGSAKTVGYLGGRVAGAGSWCLVLNADKSVILTSQTQPPSTITTDHGSTLKVLSGNVAQKWSGCMLTVHGSEQKFLDLQYYLQQAAKAGHANKLILKDRPPLFWCSCVIGCVLCRFRKFCRSIVGPPPYIDWTLEWRLERTSCTFRWRGEEWELVPNLLWFLLKVAAHIAKRTIHQWIQKILHWQRVGQRRFGRAKQRWESKLEMHCRYQGLVHWEEAAQL